MKQNSPVAAIALLLVAAAWGAAFVLMKPAIASQPFYDFLATRFTVAVAIMIAVRPTLFRGLNRQFWFRGIVLGALLAMGYITQTIALEITTAAITGFLTGLYVVLTPLLSWIVLRRRVTKKVLWGAILATIGLGLISITGFTMGIGEIWGIICAVLFAAHIVGLSVWSTGKNTYALTVIQLAVVAALSWIGALPDGFQAPENFDVWFAILFTAIFSTAVGFFVQTWAQSHMDASRVAIILTTEVVFAAAFSVAVGQEVLSLKTLIGGVIMVIAMLMVEWPSRKTN
jgi:drug/metabolite transporter (DMT)-like permease